ncbi:actin filament-associated protein 1-like 2 isoform X1 [Trachemys scripta elegans]|uniref:actin filament-associated protein 1-like 2 isoform X1 n=1 Tax=Trachemys scripta elegans TaxID=31138 RepID=UPI001554381A|nr:actin filament-associated protein 1-like 2 isoform X1 [Trachemys scripta elegans]
MEKFKALEQLLTELEDFLKILDEENLSSTAVVKKCFLSDLLRVYTKTSSGDEEYIYMNKVTSVKQKDGQEKEGRALDCGESLSNGESGHHSSPPQKSLPDLPPPKIIAETKLPSIPKIESPEAYYEEAEPYDISVNEDGEAVSSSYESYDEEESSKGKSATHQWPSTEATIELMKDARICAFLWRKKWLGQWAKQLCVIKDTRLLCYKSSKDHTPQLDVNLLGCSVIHKEKQVKKKEHKLKIIPMTSDVIVLGLQSKDQAEQWLRVIQETSGLQSEGVGEGNQYVPDSHRLSYLKADLSERHSVASESGSSTDGHPESIETKDVKKKGTTGLKLSNLMNLGRKKSSSLESPERTLETSSYLNILVNSQWRSRWCHIKNGHLHFYQDKNRSKSAQQPLSLAGCEIIPDPTPDHLYSFRILHSGEELAKLEAKSSEEMGHWLGLLLSESGSKTDPEEFTYDYVDADRISCIVSAAKNSFFLMQRKCCEPNTYIDNLPKIRTQEEELYDDVDPPEGTMEEIPQSENKDEEDPDKVYLDLTPVKSFLHSAGRKPAQTSPPLSPSVDYGTETPLLAKEAEPRRTSMEIPDQTLQEKMEPEESPSKTTTVKIQMQQHKIAFPQSSPDIKASRTVTASPQLASAPREKVEWPKVANTVPVETKLGKNRMEAEVKRYTEEKERLEKEKEEIRSQLTQLRKERRELKETLASCPDSSLMANVEQKLKEIDEECKKKESRRVDLELSLVEVKENLKKAESGPVTLGTTVDTTHLENASPKVKMASPTSSPEHSPVNSATALKNRPLSIMVTGKGTVLQKAKVRPSLTWGAKRIPLEQMHILSIIRFHSLLSKSFASSLAF